jgi:thiol:disulfide interchange protein DsbD
LVIEEGLGPYYEYRAPFTWSQDVLVLPDAAPGPNTLRFSIKLQVCDDKGCVWGEPGYEVPVEVTDAPAAALTPQLQERLEAKPQTAGTKPKVNASGLVAFALKGILWGLISLLTPCVFPMIPITVSFFLKQSDKEHHRPITMATVYSLTIVTVLTLGGIFLMKSFQQFSQHWLTQGVLGLLFLVFALSLFGMYEITLPSGLANLTSAQEGRGGLIGTIFMALTFTIISFTCVAPFYGGFIGLSASSATDWVQLVVGAVAFSVAFASPFFVLALFPSLLRSMPKSGSWMNTIKVVMGFLELAAAVKFLRAAELLVLKGEPVLFTYDLALGVYVALAVLCGLYLLNLYRLPHDHQVAEHLGVPRLLVSAFFLSLGLYLMPGLFKTAAGEQQRPSGVVFSWLDSFLLPDSKGGEAFGNLTKGLEDARDKRRLVFVDFTGLS